MSYILNSIGISYQIEYFVTPVVPVLAVVDAFSWLLCSSGVPQFCVCRVLERQDAPGLPYVFSCSSPRNSPGFLRERNIDLLFYLMQHSLVDSFSRFYLFIFKERGRVGEGEGEKHQCVVASCALPTGDLARNPSHVPQLGIELGTLWFAGWHSIR